MLSCIKCRKTYTNTQGLGRHAKMCGIKPPFDKKKYDAERVSEFRKRRKLKLIEMKGGKCQRCGFECDIPDVYALHHRDPSQKDPNFKRMLANNHKFEKILAEAEKCDLLCHNCHSIVHWEMREL